jgi:hypothetical protein
MRKSLNTRLAGIAYLSYIVFTMMSTIFYGKTTSGHDMPEILESVSRMAGTERITVLLDFMQMICALVLAVCLYRLVLHVQPTLALFA